MAAGDLTITEEQVWGEMHVVIGTMELPAVAIPAGGVAVGTAKFGLTTVRKVDIEVVELAATTGLLARYDDATDKIMFYDGGGAGAAFPESNEDTVAAPTPLRFTAIGRKTGNIA